MYDRYLVEKRLDDIMDNFDFYRVHNVMKALNWHWISAKAKNGVPTVQEIKALAADILWELVNSDDERIATGGLEASKDFSDLKNPFIELKFVVEEWAEGGDYA